MIIFFKTLQQMYNVLINNISFLVRMFFTRYKVAEDCEVLSLRGVVSLFRFHVFVVFFFKFIKRGSNRVIFFPTE